MLVLLLLLTSGGLVHVAPSAWHSMKLNVPRGGSIVTVQYAVQEGSRVQVLLMDETQASRFRRGRSFHPLAASGFGDGGRIRQPMPESGGSYVLVVDNRIDLQQEAVVQMEVAVSRGGITKARELTPERRRAVVAISLGFFGAVLAASAALMLRRV